MVPDNERHIGLGSATGIGVGAIVGGGILALAGVAFATTGPAALLAFALNGLIALLTALSLGEMASKFPESGGTYAFSRKVLSIEAAFAVGWIVWFASIVAAMLYAVGFGYFSVLLLRECIDALGYAVPGWVIDQRLVPWIAILAVLTLALGLVLKSGGGGSWANAGKVLVFGILILGGLWSVAWQPLSQTQASLQPFFSSGAVGLFEAMGFSFIALQGFDLIAAVGGEIRNPTRNIPKAMVFSLIIALLIYLPLLFVITTVGVSAGQGIADAAAENPEGIVAIAARNYLGPVGYGFVLVAAVLSMFTALQANLFAASRIALAMSRDHTLPSVMSRLSPRRHTPVHAIAVTTGLISILVIALPDVAAAGAAASLIFLITFAMAHWLAVLVRRRSVIRPPFQTPWYPRCARDRGLSLRRPRCISGIGSAFRWNDCAGLAQCWWHPFLDALCSAGTLERCFQYGCQPRAAQIAGQFTLGVGADRQSSQCRSNDFTRQHIGARCGRTRIIADGCCRPQFVGSRRRSRAS